MGKTQLFIPDKCKVGFNLREDTYTGKLGYIIYHDGKVWRKEHSWESWRNKPGEKYSTWSPISRKHEGGVYDEGVAPIEFDNVPTEGFVLNKKAGGYNSGWNHRQTYSRVYDPRGWEFEITVENLIYILQECNSYKGKGLEGEFVYSWAGKDLVLLPATSPDYKSCKEFTDLQSVKFSSRKDLFEGFTYLTNRQEEWIYLGRYEVHDDAWHNKTSIEHEGTQYSNKPPKKKHVFLKTSIVNEYDTTYEFLTSFTRIKKKISEKSHPKFADYVDEYLNSIFASEADHLVVEPFDEEFIKDTFDRNYLWNTQIYKFGDITTKRDLEDAEKQITEGKDDKHEGNGEYEVYTKDDRSYWSTRNSKHSEGFFSLEELKTKYGMLMRVYKNGYKQRV